MHRKVSENVYVVDITGNSLTQDEIDQFFATGWIAKKALFNSSEIDRIRRCFDNLEMLAGGLSDTASSHGSHFVLGQNNDEMVIKRVVWAGGSQPYLLEIGADPRLTLPCSQLLGSDELEQLLSQAHFKRPNDGVIFGWHQDIQHRDKGGGTWSDVNGSGSFVQTLIAVDEMTPDSGPLMFIPGSSKWGRVYFGEHEYDDSNYESQLPEQFHDDVAVTILAEPGDTLFFGPYAAHASFENTSSTYRRVLINGYAYPGANGRVYPGEGSCRKLFVTCGN